MKKILLLVVLVSLFTSVYCQTPQGFSYQAVIRNSSGQPIANQSIRIRISLTNSVGTSYYTESIPLTTTSLGVANLNIGNSEGTVELGSLSSVPWSSGGIYIKLEVDPAGGTSYIQLGDLTKLQSVPYAQFASTTTPISGSTGQTLYHNGTTWTASSLLVNNGTNIGIATTPTQKLDLNGNFRLRGLLYDYNNSAGAANQLLVNNGSGVQWKTVAASGIASGTGTAGQLAIWNGTNTLQGLSNLSWGTTSLQITSPTTAGTDDPILEVKNKSGQVVFGVYQGGVRIYVEDSQIKGVRGGFAVGGLTNQSKLQQEYFRITPDSARIYVKDATAKGVRGGFAVGGLTNQGKVTTSQFLNLTPDNYFIGHEAGKSILLGQYNVFIGYQAGANTTGNHGDMDPTDGDNNIFLGYHAGYANITGEQNIYLGAFSGENNTSGASNTFVGSETGRYNTGYGNTLIGDHAGSYSASNYNYKNTFIGSMCGTSNSEGNGNVFIGRECGVYNSTGSNNVYIGHLAGHDNSTGSGNVFIGSKAGWYSNQSNTLIIHNNGDAQGSIPSNSLIYGDFTAKTLRFNANVGINVAPYSYYGLYVDMSATASTYGTISYGNIIGVYGIASGTGTPSSRYGVFGSASGATTNYAGYFSGNVTVTGTFANPSDKNLKKNIKPYEGALNKVLKLQGVTYEWKSETELSGIVKKDPNLKEEVSRFNFPSGTQIGVIAQDVEKILPELVKTDADGLKSVDYIKLTPVLIEAIKEQNKTITTQKDQIDALQKQVNDLNSKLDEILKTLKK